METLAEQMLLFLDTEVEPFVQESSYRTYLLSLRSLVFPALGDIPIQNLTETDLNQFFFHLSQIKGHKTAENCFGLMKRFLQYLYRNHEIDIDLSSFISLPKQKRQIFQEDSNTQVKHYFTEDDLRKLYRAFFHGLPNVTKSVASWIPLIIFQLETFLRAGEALSLKIHHISMENNMIWVKSNVGRRYNGQKTERYLKVPKSGHTRIVPLSSIAKECARKMMQSKEQIFLFPNTNGTIRSIDSYERAFRIILNALSIERGIKKTDCIGRSYGLNTHALRHTAITLANSAEGANIVNTALMAGHSVKYLGGKDIGAESTYIHAVLSELRKVKTPFQVLTEK